VDSEQREEFERAYWDRLEREKLELARAKLSPEQQARVDSHAERLREQEIYAPKHETAIAQIIYGDRSHAQEHNDIDSVYSLADYEARDRGAKERLTARMLASREAAKASSSPRNWPAANSRNLRRRPRSSSSTMLKSSPKRAIARRSHGSRRPRPLIVGVTSPVATMNCQTINRTTIRPTPAHPTPKFKRPKRGISTTRKSLPRRVILGPYIGSKCTDIHRQSSLRLSQPLSLRAMRIRWGPNGAT